MVIAPGCLCICRQCGTQLFVVKSATDDGLRWNLVGKMTDAKGRVAYSARVAGQGDILVVRAADTFEPGNTLEHDGQTLTVLLDLGSEVEFEVPASSRPLPGGGSVRNAAGHTTTIHKADLILRRL